MSKSLTLSIVIPVYNEEDYIKDCLESIENQTVQPDEVIVVDNNSTDNTLKIAERFAIVRIVRESRQSQVFAQKTGLLQAKSDIIGRIDADDILPKDWCEKVLAAFASNADVVGVTGGADPYDVPLGKAGSWIFNLYHELLSGLASGHTMLWGSNCAVRKRPVQEIAGELLERTDIWEDYDLSFLLAKKGSLCWVPDIQVQNSFRAAHKSPRVQISYQLRAVRTFWLRATLGRFLLFALFWSTLPLIYPIPLIDGILQRRRDKRKLTGVSDYLIIE